MFDLIALMHGVVLNLLLCFV